MISVVVLTHNDEKILARCLGSLVWCDEIIVVDDFSEDKTRQIAQKLNAKVYLRHVNHDFASQRNFALARTVGEWVLFVDSDEIVSTKLANEIKQNTTKSTEFNGFLLHRRDYLWGRQLMYGETANICLLRLGRKNSGTWERPVHEIWKVTGDIGSLRNPLQHFPHPNVAQFLTKINYYSTIRSQELFDQKIHINVWQIIAYPALKFLLNYFWRLGFLDGVSGVVHAIMMSFHSFLVRAKLYVLRRKNSHL